MCGALHFQRHFHHSYNLNKAFVKSNNSIRSPKERTGQAQVDKDTMWALTHQIRKGGRSKKTEICEIDQSQILLPIYSSGRGAGRTQPKHHFNCNLSHFPAGSGPLNLCIDAWCSSFRAAEEPPPETPLGLPKQRGASLIHRMPASTQPSQWGHPSPSRSPMLSYSYLAIRRGTWPVGWESREFGILQAHTKEAQTLSKC